MEILKYKCYREFLGDLFQQRKVANRNFSFQYAANKLGKSKSFLKVIIEKQRHISIDNLPSIAKLFELNDEELHYLTILVIENTTRDEAIRSYFQNVMIRLRDKHTHMKNSFIEESENSDTIFLGWLSQIIHSMSKLKGFEPTVEWIQPRLRDKVSKKDIKLALNQLLETKSIIQSDERWKPSKYIFQGSNAYEFNGFKIYKIGTIKITDCLNQIQSYIPHSHYMMTLGIKKQDIPVAFDKFNKLRNELIEMSVNTSESEVVLFISNNMLTLAEATPNVQ